MKGALPVSQLKYPWFTGPSSLDLRLYRSLPETAVEVPGISWGAETQRLILSLIWFPSTSSAGGQWWSLKVRHSGQLVLSS